MQTSEPNTVVVIEFIVVSSRLSWCVYISYLSIVRRCWKPHFNRPAGNNGLSNWNSHIKCNNAIFICKRIWALHHTRAASADEVADVAKAEASITKCKMQMQNDAWW